MPWSASTSSTRNRARSNGSSPPTSPTRTTADRLLAEVGRVDVLVNNAAILVEKPIEETSVAEFDLTMAVNLRAPFLLSRAFGAGMRERGWGRIVNIASIAARTGGTSQVAAYGASKAGLVALTKNFARNYGPGRRDRQRRLSGRHPDPDGRRPGAGQPRHASRHGRSLPASP